MSSGVESLRRALEEARQVNPEPPRPLTRELPDPSPWPVEALGHPLAAAIGGIQDKTQAPAAICAQAVLATACLAVQGSSAGWLIARVRPTSF